MVFAYGGEVRRRAILKVYERETTKLFISVS